MDILTRIQTALANIGVPVAFQFYKGTALTYITFFVNDESGTFFADNDEKNTRYDIRVNIWSKSNNPTLQNNVKIAMKNAGFIRVNGLDAFDPNSGLYNKSFNFTYVE